MGGRREEALSVCGGFSGAAAPRASGLTPSGLLLRVSDGFALVDPRTGAALWRLAAPGDDAGAHAALRASGVATVVPGAAGGNVFTVYAPAPGGVRTWRGGSAPVTAAWHSPAAALLATACADGALRVWDTDAAACTHVFPGAGAVTCALFVPGLRLAAGAADGSVAVWSLRSSRPEWRIPPNRAHSSAITAIVEAELPDGKVLISAGRDSVVSVIADGKVVFALAAGAPVSAMGLISPRCLFTAGDDGVLRTWALSPDGSLSATGFSRPVCAPGHAISAGGIVSDSLVLLSTDGLVHVHALDEISNTTAPASVFALSLGEVTDAAPLSLGAADGLAVATACADVRLVRLSGLCDADAVLLPVCASLSGAHTAAVVSLACVPLDATGVGDAMSGDAKQTPSSSSARNTAGQSKPDATAGQTVSSSSDKSKNGRSKSDATAKQMIVGGSDKSKKGKSKSDATAGQITLGRSASSKTGTSTSDASAEQVASSSLIMAKKGKSKSDATAGQAASSSPAQSKTGRSKSDDTAGQAASSASDTPTPGSAADPATGHSPSNADSATMSDQVPESASAEARPVPNPSAATRTVVVTGSRDATAAVWLVSSVPGNGGVTTTLIARLEGHTETVGAVSAWRSPCSPSLCVVATAGADGTVKLWDVDVETRAAASRWTMAAHAGDVNAVHITPDGAHVVTASQDRSGLVLRAADGSESGRLGGHRRGIWGAALSPKEAMAATACADGCVRLFSLAPGRLGECLWTLDAAAESAVLRVAFSSDGRSVVAACADGTLRLWALRAGRAGPTPVGAALEGHGDRPWALAALPDDATCRMRFASGDASGALRVWRDVRPDIVAAEAACAAAASAAAQRISNLVHRRDWRGAAALAAALDQPARLYSCLCALVSGLSIADARAAVVDAISPIASSDPAIAGRLWRAAAEWNVVSRRAPVAHLLAAALPRGAPGGADAAAAMRGHTARHVARLTDAMVSVRLLDVVLSDSAVL